MEFDLFYKSKYDWGTLVILYGARIDQQTLTGFECLTEDLIPSCDLAMVILMKRLPSQYPIIIKVLKANLLIECNCYKNKYIAGQQNKGPIIVCHFCTQMSEIAVL